MTFIELENLDGSTGAVIDSETGEILGTDPGLEWFVARMSDYSEQEKAWKEKKQFAQRVIVARQEEQKVSYPGAGRVASIRQTPRHTVDGDELADWLLQEEIPREVLIALIRVNLKREVVEQLLPSSIKTSLSSPWVNLDPIVRRAKGT